MKLGKFELNDVYLGDSYELIKDIPDKSIDLVIIDPPYEFVMSGIGGCFGTKNRSYHSQLADTDVSNSSNDNNQVRFVSHGITNDILDELCRVMKKINIYVWCNKNQLRQLIDYFDDKGCFIDLLTWHKTNPIPTCNNTYLSDTEYCVFARESGVKVYGYVDTKKKYFVSSCNKGDKDDFLHPTIKPLEYIKNLIINSSLENEIVFDCFLGSGTTCVAAKELGRQYIGIELNENIYNIAKDRLNGINQRGEMNLFDTDFDKLEQGSLFDEGEDENDD